MDRLYPLIACAALVLTACEDRASPVPTQAGSRVNAVVATKTSAEAPAQFCDVYHADGAAAPTMKMPDVTTAAPAQAAGWRWLNVWATWCKPCIEEMPRLAAWERELASHGLGDVLFVSADESDELVANFRAENPEAPASLRLTSPDRLQPWLAELGLTEAPSLPVHLFVDASQKLRCVRMGGVTERDRGAVERLLAD